jgi:hypothetical protein
MRSTVRQITIVILLLAVLLAPGLLQARTPIRHEAQSPRASVSRAIPQTGSFSSVWNLLSNWLKTGVGLDPSGGAPSSGSTSNGDTGTQLDPSGTPK